MSPTRPRVRFTGRAVVLAVGAGLLAGCAQLPVVAVPVAGGQIPLVVQPAQAERIVAVATTVLGATDPATIDLGVLATRVAGPELDYRSAARTAASAGAVLPGTGGADDLEPLTSLLPRQERWPRWFMTVTQPGSDRAPSVVVLRSASAREPYRIWATPTLLPGQALPALVAPAEGVAVVTPDEDTNLPMTPVEVADRYADVLTTGDRSAYAGQFGTDAYRSDVSASSMREREALTAAGGSLLQEHTLLPGSVIAARTRDGGALVVAGYRWSSTAAGPPGALAGRLEAPLAALAGRPDARRAVVVREEVVVFAVSPGDKGTIDVLATQSGVVSVEAS